jgi:hypothetical protein
MKRTLPGLIAFVFIVNQAFAQWAVFGGSLNSTVLAVTQYNSETYVGGSFTIPSTLAKWNGTSWAAVGAGLNGATYVYALTAYNNALYVGGNFTSAGSAGANSGYLAKWDGSNWTTVGNGANQVVKCFTTVGSVLYVGGKFTAVNNTGGQVSGSGCIAKWDGTTWTAVGSGITGSGAEVDAIASMGTDVYVGGKFTTAGSTTVTNIAKWDGSAWSAVGNPGGTIVYSLASFNGSLYAGGDFGVKKWTGSSWVALGTGLTGANISVLAMINYNGGLTIGGYFQGAGAVSGTANIARWNSTTWFAFNSTMNGDADAFYVNPAAPATLYAGGTFTGGVNGPYSRLAKYTTLVGIDEKNIAASDVRIYPNPTHDKFTINLSSELKSDKAEMIVYNVIGKQVLQQSIIKNLPIDINCKELAAGIYFVKVMDADRSFTQKVIVE